jgi:hypothetical protein
MEGTSGDAPREEARGILWLMVRVKNAVAGEGIPTEK